MADPDVAQIAQKAAHFFAKGLAPLIRAIYHGHDLPDAPDAPDPPDSRTNGVAALGLSLAWREVSNLVEELRAHEACARELALDDREAALVRRETRARTADLELKIAARLDGEKSRRGGDP